MYSFFKHCLAQPWDWGRFSTSMLTEGWVGFNKVSPGSIYKLLCCSPLKLFIRWLKFLRYLLPSLSRIEGLLLTEKTGLRVNEVSIREMWFGLWVCNLNPWPTTLTHTLINHLQPDSHTHTTLNPPYHPRTTHSGILLPAFTSIQCPVLTAEFTFVVLPLFSSAREETVNIIIACFSKLFRVSLSDRHKMVWAHQSMKWHRIPFNREIWEDKFKCPQDDNRRLNESRKVLSKVHLPIFWRPFVLTFWRPLKSILTSFKSFFWWGRGRGQCIQSDRSYVSQSGGGCPLCLKFVISNNRTNKQKSSSIIL